jgi:hypothetical protein
VCVFVLAHSGFQVVIGHSVGAPLGFHRLLVWLEFGRQE